MFACTCIWLWAAVTPTLPLWGSIKDYLILSYLIFFLGTIITQEPKKAQQRMYFLWPLKKFNLPKTMMVHFYIVIIESILISSITIWDPVATAKDKGRLQRLLCWEGDWLQSSIPPGPACLQDPDACRKDCGWPLPPWTQTVSDTPLIILT